MKSSTPKPTPLQEFVKDRVEDDLEGSVALDLPVGENSQPLVYDSYNERMKLYGVRPQELEEHAPTEVSEDLASKITIYAPPGDDNKWQDIGFQKEAVIRGFFESEDAHLWATYTSDERENSPREEQHRSTVQLALSKPLMEAPVLLPGYQSDTALLEDSSEIAALLDRTFEDYPTPIDQDIIAEQIANEDNLFRVVRGGDGEIAAVASAAARRRRSISS